MEVKLETQMAGPMSMTSTSIVWTRLDQVIARAMRKKEAREDSE